MNTIGNQNIYIKLNILENKVNDFIDGVYENVKAPMNYICDTMNNRFIENR